MTLGWRGAFWVTLAAGGALFAWALKALPETLSSPRPLRLREALRGHGLILADAVFRHHVLAVAAAFAALSAFFAGSPAVLIGTLGVSPVEYGLYPPFAVSGFVIGGILVWRSAGQVAPRRLVQRGAGLMLAGCVLLALPQALGWLDRFAIAGAMGVVVTGLGVLLPAAIASALQRFPDRAGAAAGLQGAVQMAGDAVGAGIVAALQAPLGDLAFPAVMPAGAALAFVAALRLPRIGGASA